MSVKAPGAGEGGEGMGGGGWGGKNGQRWSQEHETVKSTIKLVFERSEVGTFRARFLCKIRVLGWFVN